MIVEKPLVVFGVQGTYTKTERRQHWVSDSRKCPSFEKGASMRVTVRFDDRCGNGAPDFAITAAVTTAASRRRDDIVACGTLHDDIKKLFPSLGPLTAIHGLGVKLTSYVENTVYLASDADCFGRRAGEPDGYDWFAWVGDSPLSTRVSGRFARWIEKCVRPAVVEPLGERWNLVDATGVAAFKDGYVSDLTSKAMANEWALAVNTRHDLRLLKMPVSWSKGKVRELAAARQSAYWPEATDEQLSLPKEELVKLLEARKPALLAHLRQTVLDIGFVFDL